MGSGSDNYRVESSGEYRLPEFKGELIESLVLRRGRFWELIRSMRFKYGVKAITQIPPDPPPGNRGMLYPANYADSADAAMWTRDIEEIRGEALPSPRYALATNWRAFISACVLYDPPADSLREFAGYGGTELETISQQDEGTEKPPEMLAPPLVRWPNPHSWAAAHRDSYTEALHNLAERYLKPVGVDPDQALSEVLHDAERRLKERLAEIPFHDLILVDEHTSQPDVRSTLAMISAVRERPQRGRRQRDRLTALECALLKDRQGWSYEQLAARYGWQDETHVSDYLESGRSILRGEK